MSVRQSTRLIAAESLDSGLSNPLRAGDARIEVGHVGTWCTTVCLTNGWLADPEREVAEGIRLARCAAGVGMDDPVALLLGGAGSSDLAGETDSGIAYVDRAIVLNPNLSLAWGVSGWLRMYRGEHADAIERLERAMRLSPVDLYAYRLYGAMGWTHLFAGRYDEAAFWARKAALQKPGWAVPPRIEATACALAGRAAEAQEALARMQAIDPDLRLSDLGKQRGVPHDCDVQKTSPSSSRACAERDYRGVTCDF